MTPGRHTAWHVLAPQASGTRPSGAAPSDTGVSGTGVSGTGVSGTGVSGTGVSGTGADARLDAVRRFRGRLLWDGGRRPSFTGPDGPYDADPADRCAYHVLGLADDGSPEAALRVLPLGPDDTGVCDRLLGAGITARTLDRLGIDPSDVWEGSGWAVRTGRGRARLAAVTLAAGVAAGRELGRDTLLGASGTRYGQLHRVLSAGFRRVDHDPVPVPGLADDLQLVYGSTAELRPEFRALVDDVAPALRWVDAPQGSPAG